MELHFYRIARDANSEVWEIEMPDYRYLDRLLIIWGEKKHQLFLLSTHENVKEKKEYIEAIEVLVKPLETPYEMQINYIPVFFGSDYDEVVFLMDSFIEKIKTDYL